MQLARALVVGCWRRTGGDRRVGATLKCLLGVEKETLKQTSVSWAIFGFGRRKCRMGQPETLRQAGPQRWDCAQWCSQSSILTAKESADMPITSKAATDILREDNGGRYRGDSVFAGRRPATAHHSVRDI